MKNYEELTRDFIDFYKKKYGGELVIQYIEFKTKIINDNHVIKLENSYEIYLGLSFLTLDSNSWDVPHSFKSKISFESAIKMAKIAINGYLESLIIEKDFVEVDSEKRKLIDLLSVEIKSLHENDFNFIIEYYANIEDYGNADKYKRLKEKYL